MAQLIAFDFIEQYLFDLFLLEIIGWLWLSHCDRLGFFDSLYLQRLYWWFGNRFFLFER